MLLIVHHTPSANTRALLERAVSAARSAAPDLPTRIHDSLEADASDVRQASGVLLATTENFGAMAGRTKDFFERIYYPLGTELAGLPFACYVRAGQDGAGTVSGVERIVTGLRWRTVRPTLVLQGSFRVSMHDAVADLSATLAAGLDAEIF